MLEENVPNPLAKNPNFNTHKVFAAIGLVLTAAILVLAGIWIYVENQSGTKTTDTEDNNVKVSTSSAKKATNSAGKDETADWKTYTNKVLGFSIKYPAEWKITEQTKAVFFQKDFQPGESGNVSAGQSIEIYVDSNPTKKSIGDWWGEEATDYLVSNEKSFTVDGNEAIKYNVTSSGVFYGALIDRTDNVYRIELSAMENLKETTLKIFELMVSTFKFL